MSSRHPHLANRVGVALGHSFPFVTGRTQPQRRFFSKRGPLNLAVARLADFISPLFERQQRSPSNSLHFPEVLGYGHGLKLHPLALRSVAFIANIWRGVFRWGAVAVTALEHVE